MKNPKLRELADYLIGHANAPKRIRHNPRKLLRAAHLIELLEKFLKDVGRTK